MIGEEHASQRHRGEKSARHRGRASAVRRPGCTLAWYRFAAAHRARCQLGCPRSDRSTARAHNIAGPGVRWRRRAAMGCAFVTRCWWPSVLGQGADRDGSESGNHVRVDDVWHPGVERLRRADAATNANLQPVSESTTPNAVHCSVFQVRRSCFDQPLAGAESAWAICDSDTRPTVVVGPPKTRRRRCRPPNR